MTRCKYLLPKSFIHLINIIIIIRLGCRHTSLKSRDSSHERCKGTFQNHFKIEPFDPIYAKKVRDSRKCSRPYTQTDVFLICVRLRQFALVLRKFALVLQDKNCKRILSYAKKDKFQESNRDLFISHGDQRRFVQVPDS